MAAYSRTLAYRLDLAGFTDSRGNARESGTALCAMAQSLFGIGAG